MTTPDVPLLDLLRNAEVKDVDCLREATEWLWHPRMEAEVSAPIGAQRYERSTERTTSRNGHRGRDGETRLDPWHRDIPKLRKGSYYPNFLEPPIQEAYVAGVSTRQVDQLVQALGMTGISKSQVAALCQGLDERVEPCRNRPIEGQHPSVGLDATSLKVREDDRVVSMAFVVATGVNDAGDRVVLGFDIDIGPSEEAAFWTALLRDRVVRGLRGVPRVISDAHTGLPAAIRQVLQGATWPRCRVHCMRHRLAHVPRSSQAWVAALVKTLVVQPDQAMAREELATGAAGLRPRFPNAADVLRGRGGGRAGLQDVPEGALAAESFDQSPGTAQQRNRAPRGRRGHVPASARGFTASRGRVDGVQG